MGIVFIVFLVLLLFPFRTESQISKEVNKEIKENPEKELNVLIQVKDKNKITVRRKQPGLIPFSKTGNWKNKK